jgi:AraC family transcriptional regulator, L-rhamnose operon regulatory protein RhaS
VLYTSSQSRGSIVQERREQEKLSQLLNILETEYENHTSSYFEIIRDSTMRCMITILARNLTRQTTSKPVQKDSVESIIMYIKQQIYNPAKLTVDHLADVFNYAPEYISIFFKRHTGESLKQYIIKHKVKLVEARLMYSQLPLGTIAYEFGYVDESHFSKQFKKYTGTTPSRFRRSMGSRIENY